MLFLFQILSAINLSICVHLRPENDMREFMFCVYTSGGTGTGLCRSWQSGVFPPWGV